MDGLELPFPLKPVVPALPLAWMGPYSGNTLQEAIDSALQNFKKEVRKQTVVVHLVVDGQGYLYWFKDGVEDSDFVPWNPNAELYSIASASRSPLRAIYSKFQWDDLSDFQVVGTAPTIVNRRIAMEGVAAWNFDSSRITRTFGHSTDQVDFEVTFQLKAKTGWGLVLGRKSRATLPKCSMSVYCDLVNNKLGITDKASETDYTSNYNKEKTFTGTDFGDAGNYFKLIFSQRINVVTATLVNLTKQKFYRLSLSSEVKGPAIDPFFLPNFSSLSISALGTPIEILNIREISREPINARIAVVGDSKAMGYNSDSCENRWASLLDVLGSVAVYAAAADTLADIVRYIDYVIEQRPEYLIISGGRNDVEYDVPGWQNNYRTVRNKAAAAGIKVIHLQGMADYPAVDQTVITNLVRTEWPTDVLIDMSTTWVKAIHVDPTDNLHPTPLGHAHMADRVISESGIPPLAWKYSYERAPLPLTDYFEAYEEPVTSGGGGGPVFQPWHHKLSLDANTTDRFTPPFPIAGTGPADHLLFLGKSYLEPSEDYVIDGNSYRLTNQDNIDAAVNDGAQLSCRWLGPTQVPSGNIS